MNLRTGHRRPPRTIIPLPAALILALMPLAVMTAGCRRAPASKPTQIRYVALGDSITAGWGASDPAHSLTGLFAAYLKHGAPVEMVTNLGVPGLNSQGLLHQLQTQPAVRDSVRSATIITISIGGNDLLPCVNPLEGGVDTACADASLKSFEATWPAILHEIRDSIGSRARLYVLNLYDVYPVFIPGQAEADHVVRRLNAIITNKENRSIGKYQIVDVYSAFEAGDICSLTHVCTLPPDPHPTDAGYRLMAGLLEREAKAN